MIRWGTVCALGALVASLAGQPAGAAGDIRSAPLDRAAMHETLLTVQNSAGEPSLALSARDHVFICAPLGIPGGQMRFVRSANWFTFSGQTISDRAAGGDCHVAVGPDPGAQTGEAVYVANLQAAASAIRKSTDDGITFGPGVEDPVEQDRQWLAADPADPNVVYMAYHDWSISAIIVAKSTDGGQSWISHSVASADPLLLLDAGRASTPGPMRVDPTDHLRLYAIWTQGSLTACAMDPAPCVPMRHHTTLAVARSDDAGATWTPHVALSLPSSDVVPNLIPWLSLDKAGNLYATVAGRVGGANGIYTVVSSDHGVTWSAPIKVNAGTGAVVFPTVAGGADGIADFSWVESTAADPDDTTGVWSLHFAQSRNPLSPSPTFTEVSRDKKIHDGDVCTRGIGCLAGGDRTLLDFMDLQIDSFGYAHMVVFSTADGGRTVYWRQDAGPSALSEPDGTVTVRPGPRP